MYSGKVCVDTDVLIWYLRGEETIVEWLDGFLADNILICCSVVVRLEVLRGMRMSEEKVTRALLDAIVQIPVNEAIIEQAYHQFVGKQKQGTTLPFVDSIIAATAEVEAAPLLTLNKKHYPKKVVLREMNGRKYSI